MSPKTLHKKQPKPKQTALATPAQPRTNFVITPFAKNNNGLPEGWKWVKLGEVCNVIMGQSPPSTSYNFERIGLPFFQGKAEFTDLHPLVEKWCNAPNKIAEPNDILLSVRAPVGTTNIADQKCCIGRGLAAIRFPNYKYAFYFLRSIEQQLDKKGTGTTFRAISGETIRETLFPLPDESVQHAIVSKIEELLSELDKGKQQLETAQQQLKIYRQAVLKWAFEGRLNHDSSDFDDAHDSENQTNQKNQKNHSADNLPKGWKWVKTIDVIETINNGYTPTKEFLSQDAGEIPFIKVYNLNFDGTLNFKKNPTFIPATVHAKDLKRSICYPGDVLINIVGPPLGKVSIVTDQFPEWNINQAIVMFRPNEKVSSKYLSYFLQNKVTVNWLENTSKATAGQWNIKVSTCREIPFPIFSIEEQHQIVQEIESRLSVCDKVEETITSSLSQAEVLRQSILKQAFEGKLIKPLSKGEGLG
ncbi:MAG: restriction endonuclease subunit S [Bacteroidota bacterium]